MNRYAASLCWFRRDLRPDDHAALYAASTGCDAQPYFRISNPVTQSRRFDPEGAFSRKYVPELAGCDNDAIHAPWQMDEATQRKAGVIIGRSYPAPVVDHAARRKLALALYGKARRPQGAPAR